MKVSELGSICNKVQYAKDKEVKIRIMIDGRSYNYNILSTEEMQDTVMHETYLILNIKEK